MLAILATHPIQYHVPIWQILARRATVPFEVWYLTAHGVAPSFDPEFGKVFAWDLPLLDGYPHRFPKAGAPTRLGSSLRVGLPAEYAARLRSGEVSALFVPGWNVRACWEAAFIAHWHGVPVWMRGDSNDLKIDVGAKRWVKRRLLGALFRRVDRFLCVGAANRRLYQSYGVGPDKLAWAPHAVDNERFSAQAEANRARRTALRARWNIPQNSFCVLFAGKLIPKKNPSDVVEALRRLQGLQGEAYHGLFVGVGELGGELRTKVFSVFDAERGGAASESAGTSSAPWVSWAGFLNQTEISEAYVAADVLVLPSEVGETWGLVVNEALASGLPAIVSSSCGCAEDLVTPLDASLSFPVGNIDALVGAIRHARKHPLSRERLAEHIAKYQFAITVSTVEEIWTERCRALALPERENEEGNL
jgi:glycosyltransferase involved in cell wall biosynthesis